MECPFILLVKDGCREGRVLGNEEDKEMESGLFHCYLSGDRTLVGPFVG